MQDVAQDVIASLLSQKDDALDHDLAALGMKMRKDLDEDQLDDCMAEIQQVVMNHIKKARAGRRYAQQRDAYLADPNLPMPLPPAATEVVQVGEQNMFRL